MAYFKRNGFVPVHEADLNQSDQIGVKDVKYIPLNTRAELKNPVSKPKNLGIVMMYGKCLIRNLLLLSRSECIERDTFLEFTATWTQFTSWQTFRKTRSDFPFHDLMVRLGPKLLAIAKSNSENDLVELVLSGNLNDQLERANAEMCDVQEIRFGSIRF